MQADFTLAGLIRSLAKEAPDRPALTCENRTVSFGELDRRSSQIANAMVASGVGPGDRVAMIARNCPAYYELMLGAAKIRAVLVGVNFRLAAPEIAAVAADAQPRLTFVDADLAHLVEPSWSVVTLDEAYDDWCGQVDDDDPSVAVDPDGVVLQLYSSGTTGTPKGVMLTHANLSWTPHMGHEIYGMDGSSVNLVTSPLFHIGGTGYSLTTFAQGGQTVLAAGFNAETVLSMIESYRVTHAFLVPTVIRQLVDTLVDRPTDLSSLELIAYGAAPIDDRTLLEAMTAFGSRFLGVYGMTETAGLVSSLAPEDHDPGGPRANLLRSVGRPFAWHEVKVFDPETEMEAEPGTVGEIWVRSPQNMAGYWGQPELTSATLRADGWLRTGDAAWCDAEGYFFLHDRLKDMIISGGENIYPAEVERVLATHPGVREVIVVGVPHPHWGETVKAIVVATAETDVTEAELISYTRDRLAHYKCPTSVDFVDAMVRNAAGKVLKRVMRDAYSNDVNERTSL